MKTEITLALLGTGADFEPQAKVSHVSYRYVRT